MLNRRHLRVRVLQTFYSFEMAEEKTVAKFENALMKSIDEVYEMYIWALNLIDEICAHVNIDAELRANKYLPGPEDLLVNRKIDTNTFINSLRLNRDYVGGLKKYNVSWSFDPEIVRLAYYQLRDSEAYKTYLAQEDRSINAEKDVIKYLFRKIILTSPSIDQAFEAQFINWPIDKDVLQAMIAKTLKNFTSEVPSQNRLANLTADWVEDKNFATSLLINSVRYKDEFDKLISEKTQNWDADRIALMDVLNMRMALCELLYFPSIPVKVTMNEYIDLAKSFSTPKSNTFINGILDKLLTELKEQNRIIKNDRGLME